MVQEVWNVPNDLPFGNPTSVSSIVLGYLWALNKDKSPHRGTEYEDRAHQPRGGATHKTLPGYPRVWLGGPATRAHKQASVPSSVRMHLSSERSKFRM